MVALGGLFVTYSRREGDNYTTTDEKAAEALRDEKYRYNDLGTRAVDDFDLP